MEEKYPDLPRDGVEGLWDYTTDNGYDAMNGELRVPGSSEDAAAVQARIDATNDGISHLPAHEGITYRGTNLPDSVLERIDESGHYSDPAFTSSSLRPEVAENFYDPGGHNPTMITIEGHSGVDVRPFSAARGEAEILFGNGTDFEVVRNVMGDDGIRQLVIREVR